MNPVRRSSSRARFQGIVAAALWLNDFQLSRDRRPHRHRRTCAVYAFLHLRYCLSAAFRNTRLRLPKEVTMLMDFARKGTPRGNVVVIAVRDFKNNTHTLLPTAITVTGVPRS